MKKLSFKNYFGYGMGDLANSLTFGMSAGFLLAFYTDVLGITAAAAGTLSLLPEYGMPLTTQLWVDWPTRLLSNG